MHKPYVHGYSDRENRRLEEQATTLTELLHSDTIFGVGEHVLEAGCGVGSQTITIASKNPEATFTSFDISETSLRQARKKITDAGIENVRFMQADIFDLPFKSETFDHVFVCFVLEHLPEPVKALSRLKKMLKPGGTIIIIEGDHGSTYFYPDSAEAHLAINCQVELQARAGGNALIGRELFPLLNKAGFGNVRVSPRTVYVDSSRPEFVEGFTKNTFTAMIEGVRAKALQEKLIDPETFGKGIKDLYRTAENDGVFCYTFFKAAGVKNIE